MCNHIENVCSIPSAVINTAKLTIFLSYPQKSHIFKSFFCFISTHVFPIFARLVKTIAMTNEQKLALEEKVVEMLRMVYDPEIPVDVYSLGLIYKIDIDDDGNLTVDMTMTAPNCPMADFIVDDARYKLESIEGIKSVTINIVFEPEWTKDMMSEEAKLELGFL